VEPGQDLRDVLLRDDLRQLADGGETELPVPERLLDLGVAPDELHGGLAVLGGAGGEPEVLAEEGEEARVADLGKAAPRVELREGEEEVAAGGVLAAEEEGEVVGLFACSGHGSTIARVLEAS
jgi:hypothetical protein